MIIKSISIREDQSVWIKDNDKQLSQMVRRMLDKEMEKNGSV